MLIPNVSRILVSLFYVSSVFHFSKCGGEHIRTSFGMTIPLYIMHDILSSVSLDYNPKNNSLDLLKASRFFRNRIGKPRCSCDHLDLASVPLNLDGNPQCIKYIDILFGDNHKYIFDEVEDFSIYESINFYLSDIISHKQMFVQERKSINKFDSLPREKTLLSLAFNEIKNSNKNKMLKTKAQTIYETFLKNRFRRSLQLKIHRIGHTSKLFTFDLLTTTKVSFIHFYTFFKYIQFLIK